MFWRKINFSYEYSHILSGLVSFDNTGQILNWECTLECWLWSSKAEQHIPLDSCSHRRGRGAVMEGLGDSPWGSLLSTLSLTTVCLAKWNLSHPNRIVLQSPKYRQGGGKREEVVWFVQFLFLNHLKAVMHVSPQVRIGKALSLYVAPLEEGQEGQ